MSSPYKIKKPEEIRHPVLLSVPHCGSHFPKDLKPMYDPDLIDQPDDTDWFVDRLYNFVLDLGIPMISAIYNRRVIDLNRDPESKPLYNDGRIITGLVPVTTFKGKPLYTGEPPTSSDIKDRIDNYYNPYHKQVSGLIHDLKQKFGKALLFDAHSIRKHVPTIHKQEFPDLILGDNDGKSADPELISTAVEELKDGNYTFSHNHPFKGGYITRSYGEPSENIHALQLEMSKKLYMDDSETVWDEKKADEVRKLLRKLLLSLTKKMEQL